jgi:DNA-binding MarR family transcriptional regulator
MSAAPTAERVADSVGPDRPNATGSPVPTGPDMDVWHAFLRAHALLTRRLAAELEAEDGLSLAEFDALIQLAIAPGRRRRMSELADAVLLSRSGVSRMVDRLESAGLVQRLLCPSDARGAEAALTAAGEARLRRAAEVHFRGVAQHFTAVLPVDSLPSFTGTLEAIAEHNRAVPEHAQATTDATPSGGVVEPRA